MKGAKAKVYMEFINYMGDVTDRELIAEFCHENWADSFIKKACLGTKADDKTFYLGKNTRLVKEVVE